MTLDYLAYPLSYTLGDDAHSEHGIIIIGWDYHGIVRVEHHTALTGNVPYTDSDFSIQSMSNERWATFDSGTPGIARYKAFDGDAFSRAVKHYSDNKVEGLDRLEETKQIDSQERVKIEAVLDAVEAGKTVRTIYPSLAQLGSAPIHSCLHDLHCDTPSHSARFRLHAHRATQRLTATLTGTSR